VVVWSTKMVEEIAWVAWAAGCVSPLLFGTPKAAAAAAGCSWEVAPPARGGHGGCCTAFL
jgi:hypothetical protein